MKTKKENRPILSSNFKSKKSYKFDLEIDRKIIESPNDVYWIILSDKMKLDLHSCYTKFIKAYYKKNKTNWDIKSDEKLIELVNNNESWLSIGFLLNKSPISCIKRLYKLRSIKSYWNKEEDCKLLSLVDKFNNKWAYISTFFDSRSRKQCLQRYKILTESTKKGRWSSSEDLCLVEAVNKFKDRGWKFISQFVPHRSDAQCRERWVNVLDTKIKKGRWTKDEDKLLLELEGKSWMEISTNIEGRSINQCKRRLKILKSKCLK